MTDDSQAVKSRIIRLAEEAVLSELKVIENAEGLKRILSIIYLIEVSGSYLFYSSESIIRLKESVDNHLCFRKFVLDSYSRFAMRIKAESDSGEQDLNRILNANVTYGEYIFSDGEPELSGIINSSVTMSMVCPWINSDQIEDWIKFLHFVIFSGAYQAPFKTILNSEK